MNYDILIYKSLILLNYSNFAVKKQTMNLENSILFDK